MALTDINFQEGDKQDFLLEVPTAVYSGSFSDINMEANGRQYPVSEIPVRTDGNIFIMSE